MREGPEVAPAKSPGFPHNIPDHSGFIIRAQNAATAAQGYGFDHGRKSQLCRHCGHHIGRRVARNNSKCRLWHPGRRPQLSLLQFVPSRHDRVNRIVLTSQSRRELGRKDEHLSIHGHNRIERSNSRDQPIDAALQVSSIDTFNWTPAQNQSAVATHHQIEPEAIGCNEKICRSVAHRRNEQQDALSPQVRCVGNLF